MTTPKRCEYEDCGIVLSDPNGTYCYPHGEITTPDADRPLCANGHRCDFLGPTRIWFCTPCGTYNAEYMAAHTASVESAWRSFGQQPGHPSDPHRYEGAESRHERRIETDLKARIALLEGLLRRSWEHDEHPARDCVEIDRDLHEEIGQAINVGHAFSLQMPCPDCSSQHWLYDITARIATCRDCGRSSRDEYEGHEEDIARTHRREAERLGGPAGRTT